MTPLPEDRPAGASSATLAWTEVRVLVPCGWEELVAQSLCDLTRSGVAIGRSSLAQPEPPPGRELVRSWFPSEQDGEEGRRAISAALSALAARTGDAEFAALEVEFRPLPPEDYATSWRKGWKPFRLGRLCLLPPWDRRAVRPGELRLTIEPGAAFGSGRHATTRACLRVLVERIRPGARVLDAGSGSGILGVTAALLGAGMVIGFDVDPLTAPIARALALQNAVAERCSFRVGGFEVLEPLDAGFDAVLANIYADVIQDHAGELASRLRPGGWFMFSGCAAVHARATRAAIRAAALEIEEERVRGRWHSFLGRRPHDDR